MQNSPNWDRAINPSLDITRALCAGLDDPQTRYASVHVVGSNGKTSTSRLIEALLRQEGLRTGLTTSPALVEERERIRIDGQPLPASEWEDARHAVEAVAQRVRTQNPNLPDPSYFEIITAMALDTFARQEIDVAIVEAGIGGTWDSTCVLSPAVVVITSVSLEHTELLGDTIEAIATDKAGAVKSGSTLVLSDGVTDPVARRIFEKKATRVGAHVLTASLAEYDYEIPGHVPAYQIPNIKSAIIATEAILGRLLSPDTVRHVLATFTFPGRFEVLAHDREGNPLVIFDGAHNPEAAYRLADAIRDTIEEGLLVQKPVVALGVFDDKDVESMIEALDSHVAGYVSLQPPDETRALAKEELSQLIGRISQKPILDRWDSVHPLLVTGSLSLYGTAQELARSACT